MEIDTPRAACMKCDDCRGGRAGSCRVSEYPLIYDSWSNSFRKSPWAGCVPNNLWPQVSRQCITELLDRSTVLCAVTPIYGREDEYPAVRRVMGYSVSEPGILHWIYVKEDYRRKLVGTRLLDVTVKGWDQYVYTHRTSLSQKFLPRKWHHDPVLARVRQ